MSSKLIRLMSLGYLWFGIPNILLFLFVRSLLIFYQYLLLRNMSARENVESCKSEIQGQNDQYTSFESKYNRQKASPKWIFLDFCCFLTVSVPIVVLHQVGVPYKRGFYCDDESIKKPFKPSTVSSTVASIVGLILPGISFIVVEFLHHHKGIQRVGHANKVGRSLYVGRLKLNTLTLKILKIISIFLFGAAVNVLVTDVGKYAGGRLRPHFLAVCKPVIDWKNCTGLFITADVCTGKDLALIRQARLSFPSGHSSYSAYTMVFLVLFIQARVSISSSLFIKPLLQLVPITLALLCGLSRVSDYKHHWSDVLAGFLLGTLVAFVFVWQSLDWFRDKPEENKDSALKDVVLTIK